MVLDRIYRINRIGGRVPLVPNVLIVPPVLFVPFVPVVPFLLPSPCRPHGN